MSTTEWTNRRRRYGNVIGPGLRTDGMFQAGMAREEETAYLREVLDTIETGTGSRPKGWLGPALTETHKTPSILSELGANYVLDWCADDQPFPLKVEGMISVPYSIELNDVTLFANRNLSGPDFIQLVKDQYEQLRRDSTTSDDIAAHYMQQGTPRAENNAAAGR